MTLEEKLAAETCSGRLTAIRLHRDLRSQALADAAKISRSKLSAWENYPLQLERARADELRRVCSLLGCSMEWVLAGAGPVESAEERARRDAGLLARTYATARHLEKVQNMTPDQAGQMFDGLYHALQMQDAALAEAVETTTASAATPAPAKPGRQLPLRMVKGSEKPGSKPRASRQKAS